MKSMFKIFMALMLASTLGCSKSKDSQTAVESGDTSSQTTETSESTETSTSNVVESSYGKANGVLGDTMKATNLEFTLDDAYLTSAYQTLTPDAGMDLLVLTITTHVLQNGELKLYDTDYQVQWGGTGEEDYSVPVTYRDEWATAPTYKRIVNLDGIEGMFPGEIVLQADETYTSEFVYQVPQGNSNFTLMFQEFFEDESLGDLFIVSFNAAQQGVIN